MSQSKVSFFHKTVTAAVASMALGGVQADTTRPDALLQIDMNRAAVVERIMASWGEEVPAVQLADLKQKLMGLRADQLLAANVSGSFTGVLEILQRSQAELPQVSGDAVRAKAVGETSRDLVYTPITPCRIIDTRTTSGGTGPMATTGPERREFEVIASTFAAQGGSATDCAIDPNAVAIAANLTATGATSSGNLKAFSSSLTTVPGTSNLNWAPATTQTSEANFAIVPICTAACTGGKEMSIQASSQVNVVVDVMGYFMPPTRVGNGLRVVTTTVADTPNVTNGASGNSVAAAAIGSSIAGGGGQTGAAVPGIPATDTFTFGPNQIVGTAAASTIGGGSRNRIEQNASAQNVSFSTIGGGSENKVYAYFGTVAGGMQNVAGNSGFTTYGASVGGGYGNQSYAGYGTISGGASNQAGFYAVVPGGFSNLAVSNFSFAAGRGASTGNDATAATRYHGTFIWADSNANNADTTAPFYASANDQFAVRARGGIVLKVGAATSASDATAGCALAPAGSPSWSCSSDRNLKEAIISVSPREILNKVIAMPMTSWQYKGGTNRHLSPMAQDFWKAFRLGADDTHITSSDVSGVALAAIQGLNQKLAEKDAELAKLKAKAAKVDKLEAELQLIKKKLGL